MYGDFDFKDKRIVIQGVRVSAVMLLAKFAYSIPASAPEGLNQIQKI